ncbi:MAG TPA: autotransporter-associated beta strand repeat-containing protein [Methylomirabilota bacterium]|nr:autotransporter-associated beta strand repeat-containing protein [Methylomirabilota bacterium]
MQNCTFRERSLRIGMMLASLVLACAGGAAERTWDGGGRSADWTEEANWTGLLGPPVAGDDLRFPARALRLSNNNDFPARTRFNRLTYAEAGYTASGNEIELTGGIVVSHGTGNTTLNLPIDVGTSQTFLVSGAGASLFLNGTVNLDGLRSVLTFDGAGQIVVVGNLNDARIAIGHGTVRKDGPGTLTFLQHATFGGATIVNGGTLRVDGSLSNSAVTLNAAATLRGTGKVGALTANSGASVSPGATEPDTFDVLGNLALHAGSTLNLRLNGTNAGIDYDQLRVQGTVTLGGTLNVTAGFAPAVGERFTLIANDSTDDVVGTFAGLPEGAVLTINGRPFKISYGARFGGAFGRDVNDVTLEAVPALAVWDGGGGLNTFWREPLNWVNDILPMPGDDVQFATSSSATLVTSNDFPAGRLFGSLIFGAGRHLVGGNLASFAGNIQLTESNRVEISMPMTLAGGLRLTEPGTLLLNGAITLSADQMFWVENTNAMLDIGGSVDVGTHDLTLRTTGPPALPGSLATTFRISGSLSGSGTVTKDGSGTLLLLDGEMLGPGPVVINEGDFTVYAFLAGPGVFRPLIVNTGTVLRAVGFAGISDLEVRGGVFVPDFTEAHGVVRLLEGSTFSPRISFNAGPGRAVTTYISGVDSLELAGCALDLRVTPGTPIEPGASFAIIERDFGGPTTIGTFDGLPEGARFLADGHVFTISYQGGLSGNSVVLTADAPFVWDGGGADNLATTGANWVGDLAPISGLDLVFPDGVSKLGVLNDFPAGTVFRSIRFTGPSYVFAGNPFRLTEGLTNETASGETLINADLVASGDPFECAVAGSGRLVLDGQVRAGEWIKTGPGTLRCQGTTSNVQIRTEVRAGELELAKTPGVNAISSRLVIGDGTNAAVVSLFDDHQIADIAAVTVNALARFDLNSNTDEIGRLDGDGSIVLDGRFFRAGRLVVNSGSFSGTITGRGGLTKTGGSGFALTLHGANTYTGPTILEGGTLAIAGSQPDSPIRLDGGLLRGRGQVGTITGNSGGVVQPGSAGAVFQNRLRSRNVTFNATTTFRPVLTSHDPGFENSQLEVVGTVDLGGSALDFELMFVPSVGDSFVILDNDRSDAVTGTFAGLPEGTVFTWPNAHMRWGITYAGGDGNDVVLTLLSMDLQPVITSFSADLKTQPGFEVTHLVATGVPRASYDVQRSTNLLDWTVLFSWAPDANGLMDLRFSSPAPGPQRFYRLKLR